MRALTASAQKLTERDSAYAKRMSQPWQLRALSYYDQIGEIRFASQFYAKLLSRVRFYPALQNEDGGTEPIESGLPVEIMHRIQDPGGGRSRLQYDYGRMMFVTGEGVLFADTDEDGVERWRFLWKDELRQVPNSSLWERVRFDKSPFNPPEIGTAYRLWTPHPRHSDLADAPLRSVMSIAEELLALEATVLSTATSRQTNGMMVIPSELSPNSYGAPGDDDYLGDEDPESNVFMSDYIEHMTSQKENPGSAEAAMPFTLEGGYEYIDRVRWMATHDTATDYAEKELRKEAIWRLAIGMDFPPEFLLGMTDANHWTARQVVYDMWRSYGTPVAERFGDDISDSYLRPALRDEGYADWRNVVVSYDDSQVVIPPDLTEIAKQALEMIAIDREGYRKMAGIPEDYAPDDEEESFLASIKMKQAVDVENGELVITQPGPTVSSNGSDPEDGPPTPSGGREVSRQESRTASARIHGAAELALMRCRDLAGRRIRQRCEECGEGLPASVVASAVGAEKTDDPLKLVQGGSEPFHTWLCEQGFEVTLAASLCKQLEVYAARTLFDSRCPTLPSGFIAAIEKAQEDSVALVS